MGPAPEFRLLGPLEVCVGGRTVPVRAGKHRALLASLVLRANRPVTVDELVQRLWGDFPPARTRGTLQTYVMRLRQALGDPSLIRTVPEGYQIRVPVAQIDVHRFTATAAAARLAAARDDLTTAAVRFADAISTWRGPALVDVPSELLHQVEVPRFTEQYLRVLEDRAEIELRLGNHATLVPALRGLTGEHPLRERLWGQLMLALYRSSRQGDALEAFHEVGKVLDEQLGVGPSDELRELHRAILLGDPRLAAPRRPAVVAEQPPAGPAQLPVDVLAFTGRIAATDRLVELIAPVEPSTAVPIVTVSGRPGVGKTALAVHVAHLLRARFPDGRLYADLRGCGLGPPASPAEVLSKFLRALGVPPEQIPPDADERASMFRSLLAGRRMLVVLDDASAPNQVRPLLPGAPSCPVVVTSREDLRGLIAVNGARHIRLDPLTAGESEELLTRVIEPPVAVEEAAAVAELAELCEHLPLTLHVAGAIAARRPDRTVTDHVGDLRASEDPFDLAYSTVGPDAQRVFRLLSVVPGPDFTVHAAARTAAVDVDVATRTLAELAASKLLLEPVPGRYRFHDRLVAFAVQRRAACDSDEEQEAARDRLLEFYTSSAQRCATALALRDTGRRVEALGWLDAEWSNLTAAIRHAARIGSARAACLIEALRGYLAMSDDIREGLATAE
jgi:DNA-binding SARP family transcriptional activator